jgi:hypothetical protein
MRKTFLLPLILWATMVVLFSCQKEIEKQNTNNTRGELISKVNGWLDKQKSPTQPNKAANIDLLKENIDFSSLKSEEFNQNEKFIVLTIKEGYKIKKNIDKNTISVLLLVADKIGNIIQGNIVLYIPDKNQQMNTIPDNTFFKMYKEKSLTCDGLFRFLSPTGRWMYERVYKNGKLSSFGYVKASNNFEGRTENDCTYFFFILTLWVEGVAVAQEVTYLGRICESACDDPNNQALCPDQGGGGGGGGSGAGDANLDEFCINAAISEFQQEVNGAQTTSQTVGFNISDIDPITKNKNPTWTILTGAFGGWKLNSQEIGVVKLIDPTQNKWAWKSLSHGSISMSGNSLPTTSIEHDQGVGTPSFTPETAATTNVLYGGMSLNFSVTYRLVCNCPNVPFVGWVPPIHVSYTSNAIWDANPY